MTHEDIFMRRAWLIQHVYEHPGISGKQIFDDWKKSSLSQNGTLHYGRSTFFEDIQKIDCILGIQIKGIQNGFAGFRIVNQSCVYSYKMQKWILFMVQTKMQVSNCMHLYDRFITDHFPSERGKLVPISNAMDGNKKIRISYQCYGKNPSVKTIEPYCIKTYKKRFYVLGKLWNGYFCMFSLHSFQN